MTTNERSDPKTASADDADEPPRLHAVEVDGWPALGGPVRLDVAPRRTVIVGKNGSGKSALLEAIALARGEALYAPIPHTPPARFCCEVALADGRILVYTLTVSRPLVEREREETDGEFERRPFRPLHEEGRWSDENTLLWEATARHLLGFGAASVTLSQLPAWSRKARGNLPHLEEREIIRQTLSQIGLPLLSGPLRGATWRSERFFKTVNERIYPVPPTEKRLDRLVSNLLLVRASQHEGFDELQQLGMRLGLFRKLEPVFIPLPTSTDEASGSTALVDMRLDGVNLALVADGTLRLLEILVALVQSKPGAVLLIEEPEAGIHPGLLERFLAVLEAYTHACQVILTTHSYQVVSWAQPDEVRLMQRRTDNTAALRCLTADEVRRVAGFLREEGTLGDFIYGGALDEEDA